MKIPEEEYVEYEITMSCGHKQKQRKLRWIYPEGTDMNSIRGIFTCVNCMPKDKNGNVLY